MDPLHVDQEETVETSGGKADNDSNDASDKSLVKLCAVCGDKALGYNFNALTCESCKAFFRRNALKNKDFKCPFSNKCEVTVVTRRFCQKCRLKKCFDIGMKKEWILSDEEKQQKRMKIEENRAKKRHDGPGSHENSLESPGPDLSTGSQPPPLVFTINNDSSSLERPQARVLPSSRTPTLEDGEPLAKSPRLLDPEASSSQSSPPQFTLIKHELTTSNSPPQNPTLAPLPEALYVQPNLMAFEVQETQIDPSRTGFPSNEPETPGLDLTTLVPPPIPHQVVPINLDLKDEHAHHYPPTSSCGDQSRFSPSMDNIPMVEAMGEVKSSDGIPELGEATIDNLDDVVTVAIEAEFHVQNIRSSMHSRSGKSLNDRENDRLRELFLASRSLVEPVDLEKSPFSMSEPKNLISVINLTDLAIKRIIRMAKKITPFISMCQEDQIALLKGGCTELMILRSVINYNPDKNSWRIPSKDRPREVNMELLKEASHLGVNLYEEHQRFVKSFDPKWRTDENVMLLLSAIALFNPQRINVLHKDVVKLEQDTYYYLLRRYLETVCAGCDARRAYLHLIGRLKDLNRLNESHIQLFLGLNPRQVEPLLIEIFDLKPSL